MSVSHSVRRIVPYAVLLAGVLWTVLPLYWMAITAFKSLDEVHALPPTFLPQVWSMDGFRLALERGLGGIRDSALISGGTLVLSMGLGLPAAYSLSRLRTGGPNFAFALLMFRFMPPIAFASAVYFIAVRHWLIDSHLLLILANTIFQLPFVIWMMKGFIDEIPLAVEEAAYMDGAGWLRAMRDHVLPLLTPGLTAVGLFVVVFTWNELFMAIILTGADVIPFTRLVPGLVLSDKYKEVFLWPAMMALGMLNAVVIVGLGFYLQKYLVRALSYGALGTD